MSYTKTIKAFSWKLWGAQHQSVNQLMLRYTETGDPKLLSTLYDRMGCDLYYYLLVMSNPEIAADIAQKSWLRVIEKRNLYSSKYQFEAWLFTLARHLLFDELKKQKRLSFVGDEINDMPAEINESETNTEFHEALKSLPFGQREAFSLQQQGFSLSDIANICQVPIETIKTRLRYARAALKQKLEDQQ